MQRGPITQDWTPVVFTKTQKTKPSSFNAPNTKERIELEGDDIVKIDIITQEQAQALIEARNAKGWKQKDLANACNIDVSIIQNYENRNKSTKFNKMLYKTFLNKLGVKVEKNKETKK